MTIHEKMMKIQTTLKAPKNKWNDYGKYNYRNAEGILEAVKPLLEEQKLAMYITDDVIAVGDRVYVKATVKVQDIETEASVVTTALAREGRNWCYWSTREYRTNWKRNQIDCNHLSSVKQWYDCSNRYMVHKCSNNKCRTVSMDKDDHDLHKQHDNNFLLC